MIQICLFKLPIDVTIALSNERHQKHFVKTMCLIKVTPIFPQDFSLQPLFIHFSGIVVWARKRNINSLTLISSWLTNCDWYLTGNINLKLIITINTYFVHEDKGLCDYSVRSKTIFWFWYKEISTVPTKTFWTSNVIS